MRRYKDKATLRITLPPHVWDKIGEARLQTPLRTVKELKRVPVLDANGRRTYDGDEECWHWAQVERPVWEKQSRLQGEARWFREFIRAHYNDPIVWPSPVPSDEIWSYDHTFTKTMSSKTVIVGPHAYRLLATRATAEAQPATVVLRRLVRQALGV